MSYDRVWLCPSLDSKQWVERSEMEKQGKWDEFKRELDRLYAKGDFVVLVDCAVDEIYLFEVPADAERFYAEDYKAMECITV